MTWDARKVFRSVTTAPLLALVGAYRFFISAPLHFLGGPTSGCRFYPSCSAYATEALWQHGALFGSALAVRRILRCTPFSAGGVDFVPPPRPVRRRCVRVNPARV